MSEGKFIKEHEPLPSLIILYFVSQEKEARIDGGVREMERRANVSLNSKKTVRK